MLFKLSLPARAAIAFAVLASLAAAVLWLALAPGAGAGPGEPGYIRRFAANFTTFGAPPEIATNLPPAPNAEGGLVVYDKSFFTANDINTLYVTISAVGDTHGGARLMLACQLDNRPCNQGPNPVGGAPSGWLTAQRHDDYNDNYVGPGYGGDGGGGAGDLHDNGVNYTWCTPISGAGTHNVKVRLASGAVPGDPASAGNVVFLEAIHFFIDGSRIANEADACTPLTVGTGATSAAMASAAAQGHGN
jgi:hypothetical protein